jgi:REP element-mobilizing transposase RayT
MPRRPRIHVPGGLYHAILRGNHREAIFHCPDDYQAFEAIIAACLERYEARLHAYCWMPNHRAKLVAADAYLLALVRYIHRNPVRAGLAVDPGEYSWSSHRAYLGHGRPWWLSTEMTLALLGSRASAPMDAYRRFMAEEPGVEEIRAVCCAAEPRKPAQPPPEGPPGGRSRAAWQRFQPLRRAWDVPHRA